jgi:DNA-directed RNA polymerase subunit L
MYKILLKDENETMGNLISKQLLKNPIVTFAAYIKSNPFDKDIFVEFDTDKDPNEIFQTSIESLLTIIKSIQLDISVLQ